MPMTMAEVEAVIAGLPQVTVGQRFSHRTWFVNDKGFAWERPLSKADVKRWGDAPLPKDPILAVSTDGLEEKDAVLAAGTRGVFTIAHFNGYPAVLIELKTVPKRVARELIVDGWLSKAPRPLADAYMSGGTARGKRRAQ
jgi:hypothetical protein